MARPLRIEFPGAYYHVMSRGNEKGAIFNEVKDRERFLSYLESSVVRYGAKVHAWCLMQNHYHLFLETPGGNLAQIMRHINGAYTTYFNVKWARVGHLFQGRYQALLVEADRYATELSRYIHLNPVRAGLVDKPGKYRWSSYRNYMSRNTASAWLTTEFILGYFAANQAEAQQRYCRFVEESLVDGSSPLPPAIASTFLGSQEFVAEITEKYLGDERDERNVPAIRKLAAPRLTIEEICQKVEGELAGEKHLKSLQLYCCRQYSGAKLREIGARFGMSDAAVSQACRRLADRAGKDRQIRELIQRMEIALGFVKS